MSDLETIKLCSGVGQYHTNEKDPKKPNKTLTPYSKINVNQIRLMVDDPQDVNKEGAQWLIPSSLMSRNFKTQEKNGQFYLLWADLDKNPKKLAIVVLALKTIIGKAQYELYTTKSATEDNQKARILIFLATPLNGKDWGLCQQILNDKLEGQGIIPDRANEGYAQLCYLPNKGKFYNLLSNRSSESFIPLEAFKAEMKEISLAIADAEKEIQAKRDQAEKCRKELKYTGAQPAKLITAFNEAYTVEDILLQASYDQKGDKFRHPNSSSGRYTASVKDGRVNSLSSDDPLHSMGKGAHDAFSSFTVLCHGSDRAKALIDAGNNYLGVDCISWNKHNQREYNQEKNTMAKDPPASNDSNFSLSQFSLKGQSEKMKKEMLAEIHVMKGIALLGQITVIYAKPNTGKTLITIYLIFESIKNQDIKPEDIFYINADDSFNGMIEKLSLFEKYNMHMLTPAHNDFKTKDLTKHMQTIVDQGSAKGKVIILDTLKKFADLMDKKNSSGFMNAAREFSAKGGTLILLAHTNKNRDGDGKVVAGGTSDIIDDADCAFTLDETNHKGGIKTVLFENIKLRGNMERELGFTYSTASGQSYEERLDSIIALNTDSIPVQKQALAIAWGVEKDQPIIDAVTEELNRDDQLKTNLVNAVHGIGFPTRKVKDVLAKYEGKKWNILSAGRNSKKYSLKEKIRGGG